MSKPEAYLAPVLLHNWHLFEKQSTNEIRARIKRDLGFTVKASEVFASLCLLRDEGKIHRTRENVVQPRTWRRTQ